MESQEQEYQCSDCGATVSVEATICPKCSANLDETLEEQDPKEQEFLEIPVSSHPVNLSSILSLLNENKIEYQINNDAMENIWGPNFIQLPRLLVRKDQYELTKEIIDSFESKDIKILDDQILTGETSYDSIVNGYTASTTQEDQEEQLLKGVEGWLFFFCLSLILTPIAYIPFNIETYIFINDEIAWFPFKHAILIIDLAGSILFSVLSIYAGYNLWQVKRNAIKSTNFYLNAFLIYSIFYFLIMFVLLSTYSIPFRGLTQNMFGEMFKETISSVTYVIIWKLYLKNSERVKNTYGSDSSIIMNE